MCDELELTANVIVRELLAKKFIELSKLPAMDQTDITVVIDAITAKIIGLPAETTTIQMSQLAPIIKKLEFSDIPAPALSVG